MFIKWWKENNFPVIAFLFWRIILFAFLFASIRYIPLQDNFLGGGKSHYLVNPLLWSWLNFDGEHYLSIAQNGYRSLQYFYFPAFPFLIRLLSNIFGKSLINLAITGVVVSNVSFLLGLVGFWKLLKLDYKDQIAQKILVLLLIFPTSFYFASFYTESLFFMLTVWAFYFARTTKWFFSGWSGFLASLTRVIGISLFLALLVEGWSQLKKPSLKLGWLILIPMGLIGYMLYLKSVTGDPLEFFHSISVFGQQRSAAFISPPQVIYRYVVKILPNLNYNYFPSTFITILEFVTGLGFLLLTVVSFFKLRLSYTIYLLLGYLFPVFSGSFSSMPRYALVLFPGFVLLGFFINKLPKVLQLTLFGLLFTSLGISLSLFARGFWVS